MADVIDINDRRPSPWRVSEETARRAGRSRQAPQRINPFAIPEHPPGVALSGSGMAMDDAGGCFGNGTPFGWAGINSGRSPVFEGVRFPGWAYLAELTQRAEYRRISETIALDATRKWIELKAKDQGKDKSDRISKMNDEMMRLSMKDRFHTATVQDGYFGRGHIYIDIGTTDNPDELKTSIGEGRDDISKRKIKRGGLKALRCVEAMWCYPLNYNSTDPLDEHWYRPEHWGVMGKHVDSTRLLTLIGRPLPDILKPAYSFGGLSLSQMMEETVNNWLRTRRSVGDITHNFSVLALMTNMAQSTQLQGDDLFRRAALFNGMRDNSGLMVLDKDTEDLKLVATPLGGLNELQAQSQEHICLAKGSLIETARGQVPIEKLTIHDKVMTREGFAAIKWVGETAKISELVEITTKDSVLYVTPGHPIWSCEINEFVVAENVNRSHHLLKSRGWVFTENPSLGADVCGVSSIGVESVRRVSCKSQPVYNITIADGFLPEFYANGLLTHNCAGPGIPIVKYTGIQPAGLNASSEGEIQVWHEWVHAYQELLYRAKIGVVLDFIQLSLFGDVDEDIVFEFVPIEDMDEEQQANIQKTKAETHQLYVDLGAIDQAEVRRSIAEDPDTPYTDLDVEDVPSLREEEIGGLEPIGGRPNPIEEK